MPTRYKIGAPDPAAHLLHLEHFHARGWGHDPHGNTRGRWAAVAWRDSVRRYYCMHPAHAVCVCVEWGRSAHEEWVGTWVKGSAVIAAIRWLRLHTTPMCAGITGVVEMTFDVVRSK